MACAQLRTRRQLGSKRHHADAPSAASKAVKTAMSGASKLSAAERRASGATETVLPGECREAGLAFAGWLGKQLRQAEGRAGSHPVER